MKKNYLLKNLQRIVLVLTLLLGMNMTAQSFLISFPDHASAPTQNPRNLVVSNGSSLLKVRLDVAAVSTTGASVTVQLPTGIEYLPGTVIKTGGTAALTITENGGGANAPNFLIGPAALVPSQFMEFTIDGTVLTSGIMNLNGTSTDAYISMYTSQFTFDSDEIAVGLNNLMSIEPFTKIKTILL